MFAAGYRRDNILFQTPRQWDCEDPKRAEDPRYTVRVIGKVIRVGLETVGIVEGLPGLGRAKRKTRVGCAGHYQLCGRAARLRQIVGVGPREMPHRRARGLPVS